MINKYLIVSSVPTLMVAWGVILTLMSFAKTYQGLVV